MLLCCISCKYYTAQQVGHQQDRQLGFECQQMRRFLTYSSCQTVSGVQSSYYLMGTGACSPEASNRDMELSTPVHPLVLVVMSQPSSLHTAYLLTNPGSTEDCHELHKCTINAN
jgi:hypothetical protein